MNRGERHGDAGTAISTGRRRRRADRRRSRHRRKVRREPAFHLSVHDRLSTLSFQLQPAPARRLRVAGRWGRVPPPTPRDGSGDPHRGRGGDHVLRPDARDLPSGSRGGFRAALHRDERLIRRGRRDDGQSLRIAPRRGGSRRAHQRGRLPSDVRPAGAAIPRVPMGGRDIRSGERRRGRHLAGRP